MPCTVTSYSPRGAEVARTGALPYASLAGTLGLSGGLLPETFWKKNAFNVSGGVEIAFECDLPEASGMSSSSAVICASFLALARRNARSRRCRAQSRHRLRWPAALDPPPGVR